eukprot:CAMPEP_0184293366 /NCGR_PEP_ID=MMETSP1049-20130417/4820_1 /TAXON_ID=77928 /ORGANISM="Proteomonas sulcata, Strain CCMP704" /LENGTH=297 /DNA_ID=CAMNT_0026601329 /DNA_START=225 /DNA_END=1118 /DNA_ORIENTATION=-
MAVITWLRRRTLAAIDSEMEDDRDRYDALFHQVVQSENNVLQELYSLVAAKASTLQAEKARHFHRRKTTAGEANPAFSSEFVVQGDPSFCGLPFERTTTCIPMTRDFKNPIKSLDQLYTQGKFAWMIMREFLKQVALDHRGKFKSRFGGEPVLWSEVACKDDADSLIAWPPLKSMGRAVEKCIRIYGDDVSRVTDVVRMSILFDTVADLLACLKAIGRNNEVEILRIKNKFDTGYNDPLKSGFRVLHLNLCFHSRKAALLGVENHVCELQMGLVEFAKVSSEVGHRRYVRNRNMLGI